MIRFGVFQLDEESGELWKAGVRLRLQDQPMRILRLLLERPGEIITRDQLRQALWSGDTFVEYDHGLNAAVNKLREVLGDTAANPRFIETIPRRGYRFIAPVQMENLAPTQSPAAPPPVYRFRRTWVAGIAVLLLLGGSVWAVREHWRGVPEASIVPVPLTSSRGLEVYPRFSPDGTEVAYASAPEGGAFDIYVKTLGAGQLHRVTSHPANDIQPVWSPDGRSLVFLREAGSGELQVIAIPRLGGPERKLGEFPLPKVHFDIYDPSLDWIGDSQYLVVSMKPGPEEPRALFRFSTATGEKMRLTSPPRTTYGDHHPRSSPDGRTLVFSRFVSPDRCELFLLSLTPEFTAASEATQLTFLNRRSSNGEWASDGREILFTSGVQHEGTLWRIRPDSSDRPRPFPTGADRVSHVTASRKGDRLAYVRWSWNVSIWRAGLRDLEAAPARAFIASTRLDHMPSISPDGEALAFISNRSGLQQVWICRRDGSDPVQLTFSDSQEAAVASWTPDGRNITFVTVSEGYRQIFLLPAGGGQARQITAGTSNSNAPSWSRDGKWLYFSSDRSGSPQIWKTAAPGRPDHAPIQITRNGGGISMESHAGDFLYYAHARYSPGIWRVPVNGGREELVADSLSNGANFWVARTGLYFIPAPDSNGRTTAEFLSFASGRRRTLFPIDKPVAWGLTVSPDENTLLFTTVDFKDADLMLIEIPQESKTSASKRTGTDVR